MLQKFKVIKSTLSTKGGFANSLERDIVTTVFGVKKTSKVRLMFKTDVEVKVGTEQELELDNYVIRPMTNVVGVDSVFGTTRVTNEGVVKVSTSYWLHDKSEANTVGV